MLEPIAKLRHLGVAIVIAAPLALAGCAAAGMAVASAGAGVAMGTGVDYTLNGIAFKTFTAPLDDVKVATRNGLETMGIEVTKDSPSEKDDKVWRIEGLANSRQIGIDLQELTPRTTRIRVVAEDGIFFKDKATEAEIIFQTADSLDHPRPTVAAKKPNATTAKKTPAKAPMKTSTKAVAAPVQDASR